MTPDEQIVTELLYMVKREAARRRKEAMMHGGEAGDRLEEVIYKFKTLCWSGHLFHA